MAVEKVNSGQSLVEFVLMLPALIGMVFLLMRVNSAIQVSIVNQKYSRQRLFELVGNSSQYPALPRVPFLIQRRDNRLVVGVSEESTLTIQSDFRPSAPTQTITRTRRAAEGASDRAAEEPIRRAKVRIRNTVEMCTPLLVGGTPGSAPIPLTAALREDSYRQVTFCTGGID